MSHWCSCSPRSFVFTKFPRSFQASPPPAELSRRRRTLSATLEPPPSTLARAPGPPYPTGAHPRRSAAARAPPPPAQARRRFPCFAPPLGHRSRWPPRRSGSRTWAPRRCCSRVAARAAAGQPPPRASRPGACAPPNATARALPGGEETPPTDQWGPLVSGVKGGIYLFCV